MIAVSRPVSTTRVHLDKWCVYAHLLNGEIVYIGMGMANRPFETRGRCRSVRWLFHMRGISVLGVAILGWFKTESAAIRDEVRLIAYHQPKLNSVGLELKGSKGDPYRTGNASIVAAQSLAPRKCAAKGCRQLLITSRKTKLYHSQLCKRREAWRRLVKRTKAQA